MRSVPLGHWHYFTWHLPAAVLLAVTLAFAGAIARSLLRNPYAHGERAFRWSIVGWCALSAALTSGVVWPYLRAAAHVYVDAQGTWHLSNYLGIPVARVEANQWREVRGVDLGGLGIGQGHLEIRLADGSVIRSVRLNRDTLTEARHELGYGDGVVHDSYGDQVFAPHRYGAQGPLP